MARQFHMAVDSHHDHKDTSEFEAQHPPKPTFASFSIDLLLLISHGGRGINCDKKNCLRKKLHRQNNWFLRLLNRPLGASVASPINEIASQKSQPLSIILSPSFPVVSILPAGICFPHALTHLLIS